MFPGNTGTKFGRYHVAEPFRAELQHLYRGAPLKTVQWGIPIPVLDQEDLLAQGIDTAQLVPGAAKADALGSCTANATAASAAERCRAEGTGLSWLNLKPAPGSSEQTVSATDAVACEKWAITFYDLCTRQTGDPAQEWPPADCGSTGLYCCQEMKRQGFIRTYQTGTGGRALASMLQAGSVIMGIPWFNAWMEPGKDGFVDGDGSIAAYDAAVASGVAGGHEVCIYQLPQVIQAASGAVELQRSWVQGRNSWSASWGLSGDFRLHLSTAEWLAQQVDLKQFVL